jgi:hypothetical protein
VYFLGKFFFIQYLYKNKESEKIVEEEKKGSCIQKKERQKTIYRVKWPPFLSKQAKEDPRES